MGDKSAIQWTDATWNPLAGCTPVSTGCRNCYAASMALRLEAMGQTKYTGTAKRVGDGRAVFTGRINLDEAALDIPRRWKRPRRIFVNSMSDLFHEDVPPGFIYQVFTVMAETPQHLYQVLTKRPERIMPAMKLYGIGGATPHARPWPDNVWIGTSVETQATADERIPHLLDVPARVRFLSCEPLLGAITLSDEWLWTDYVAPWELQHGDDSGARDKQLIHWIIAGGESGPHARPCHPQWARDLRDQAVAAGVAFFWKQWGEYTPRIVNPPVMTATGLAFPDKEIMTRVGKKAAGRLLDGREWNEFPA